MKIILMLLMLSLYVPKTAHAQGASNPPEAFHTTPYPLPRFVSLRSDEVYVRSGPGAKYPVQWVFKKEALPVEIILEYENWRKIRDFEGATGWIHQSLLSGKRSALVVKREAHPIYKKPSQKSGLIAYLEPKLVVSAESCSMDWCLVRAQTYKGWIEKSALWGVYDTEKFD